VAGGESSSAGGGEFFAALLGGLDADLGGGDAGLYLLFNVGCGLGH
jgi:hypothetical protein